MFLSGNVDFYAVFKEARIGRRSVLLLTASYVSSGTFEEVWSFSHERFL